MITRCEVEHRNDITLDMIAHLRNTGYFEGKYGAPDELLLHSGGPTNDLAKRSLLMGPSTRRFVVRQKHIQPDTAIGSPLRGEINLQIGPNPIEIIVEDWKGGWTYLETIEGTDLADGLRHLSHHLPPSQGEDFQAGGLAGLLTYDMVQYTEPLKLQHQYRHDQRSLNRR